MKTLIINACLDCPFYDNEYYSYNERCGLLKRIVDYSGPVPEDCPLADVTALCEQCQAKLENAPKFLGAFKDDALASPHPDDDPGVMCPVCQNQTYDERECPFCGTI